MHYFSNFQFAQLEHAKAAQSLNGKLEIAGRTIKVSPPPLSLSLPLKV